VKSKITLLFRKNTGGYSIEKIFLGISDHLKNDFDINLVCLPFSGFGVKSVLGNLYFVFRLKGIIHITGDIHYMCLFPWKKIILTIHDIGSLFPENTSFIKRFLKLFFWVWLPVLFARRLTVVSNFTKNELGNYLPFFLKQKIQVIYNPVLIQSNKIDLKVPYFNSTKPKILHIGTKSNKNLENTISALQGINCEFWIVGKLNTSQRACLDANSTEYRSFVDLSDSEILRLYHECDIVSFISVYEGFGMPIIEAQAFCKPVITSNLDPMIEVAGTGALLVDPFNIFNMRNGFQKVINNKNFRDRIIEKGFLNQQRFEINKIVMEYKCVYEGI